MTNTLLTLDDTLSKLKISKSTLYRMIKRGDFPQQIRVSTNSVRWKVEDVEHWIKALKK